MPQKVIVIGASAGGIEALRTIVGALPRDFGAAVFAVLHMAADSPGVLAGILQRAGDLPVVMVQRSERITSGRIYVPAPDHHLVIEPNVVKGTRGPKENGFRPAVDPLFRSAAQTYGPRVIGVVLTGGLDDGTAGLWAVKKLGGTAIVQDPADAVVDSMPRNALSYVQTDHCVPLASIAQLLVRLVNETDEVQRGAAVTDEMKIEVRIAKEDDALEAGVLSLGEPSNYACPECHGVLLAMKEANRIRFRCHTGHAYSAESLLAELNDAVEDALWNAIRSIQESGMLMRHMAEHLRSDAQEELAGKFLRRADEADQRLRLVRSAALNGTAALPGQSEG